MLLVRLIHVLPDIPRKQPLRGLWQRNALFANKARRSGWVVLNGFRSLVLNLRSNGLWNAFQKLYESASGKLQPLCPDGLTLRFIPTHRSSYDLQSDCLFKDSRLSLRARYGRCDNRRDDQKSTVATRPFPGHLEASWRHGFSMKYLGSIRMVLHRSAVKLWNAFQNMNRG